MCDPSLSSLGGIRSSPVAFFYLYVSHVLFDYLFYYSTIINHTFHTKLHAVYLNILFDNLCTQ